MKQEKIAMSSLSNDKLNGQHGSSNTKLPLIGVGLRHVHYDDALSSPADIDFIEVHAENFFAQGGISHALLEDISQHYQISLHATSLGLGSASGIPAQHIRQLKQLTNEVKPILLSDHACFSWGQIENIEVHAGDLLPVPFNEESLRLMSENIQQVQHVMERQILVENLSAYITPTGSTMTEAHFLTQLCQLSDCKLLIDLNNLMVNAFNQQLEFPLADAKAWLDQIPAKYVGEIHLAGCTPVEQGNIMIDDHAQAVSDDVWALYEYAISTFGAVPTLIEWDLDLPSWQVLVGEAQKAKQVAAKALAAISPQDLNKTAPKLMTDEVI